MSTNTDISISAPLRSEESCLSRSFVSGMLFMLPVRPLVLLANLSRGTRTHYSPKSAVCPQSLPIQGTTHHSAHRL